MGANYSVVFSGSNKLGTAIAVGDLVVPDVGQPDSYVVATTAALAGRRPEAVATTPVGSSKGSFQFQQTGTVPAAISGYAGGESWVRCSAAGRIESCLSGDPQLIGRAEADGRVHLLMALPPLAEVPAGAANALVGLDGLGGLRNLTPASPAIPANSIPYWDGSKLAWLTTAGATEGNVLTIGIGLGLTYGGGAVTANGTYAGLSSLPWTLWIDGENYDSATGIASGIASAGPSGARTFSTGPGGVASRPARGNPANGRNAMVFNGTNSTLYSTVTLGEAFDTDGNTIFSVVSVGSFNGGIADASGFGLASILCDDGTYFTHGGLDPSAPGKFVAYHLDPGEKNARVNAAISTMYIVEHVFDGVTLSIRVNGGVPATVAAGNMSGPLTSSLRLGTTFNAGFANMRLYALLTADLVMTSANLTATRTALAARFGITL